MKSIFLKVIFSILLAGAIGSGICAAGYASRGDDGKWFRNGDLKTWHWSDKAETEISEIADLDALIVK